MNLCIKCGKALPDGATWCCFCGKKQVASGRKARKRPNHSGTVYRLQGNRRSPWVASRDKVILGCFATRAEAVDELERTMSKNLSEVYNWTLEEFYEDWKVGKWQRIGEHGQEGYELGWKTLKQLGDRKMRDIRTEDVQALLERLAAEGKSKSSLDKVRTLYSQLCQHAMKHDTIDRNYAEYLQMPETKPVKKRLVFTDDELKILEREAKRDDTTKIILMLIYTGFRINELLQLPLSGVLLDEGYFVGGEKTEAGRERIVPIHSKILDHVRYFYDLAQADKAKLFLAGYHGDKTDKNFRRRQFQPTLERLGIRTEERPYNPHDCRYTFATKCASAKVAPEALQKIMGHAQYTTTANIYIQEDPDMLKAELTKL